jgi:hypothetical protein
MLNPLTCMSLLGPFHLPVTVNDLKLGRTLLLVLWRGILLEANIYEHPLRSSTRMD